MPEFPTYLRRRAMRYRRPIAVAAAVIAVTAAATVAPAAATTPTPTPSTTAAPAHLFRAQSTVKGYNLKPGPILAHKYHFASEALGLITLGDRAGICYDYGKQSPDGHWTTGAIADVPNATTRVQMQWLANAYFGDAAHSNLYAAALKSALNRLRSAEFRSDWAASYVGQLQRLNPQVAPLTDRMIGEATRNAGTVRVTGAFTSKPLPGGQGTIRVAATGAGHALPGQAVRWGLTGARLVKASTKTGADGTAWLTFQRTTVTAVHFRAEVISPEWRIAAYSIPNSSARQHLIRAADRNTVTTPVAGTYDSTFNAQIVQACGTVCDGHPPVTLTATAASAPTRWQVATGTRVVGTLNLTAGQTATLHLQATDGQTLTFRYAIQVAGKWTTYRTVRSFTVVCPAWPAVAMTKTCPCKGTPTVTYTVTAPGGPRGYVIHLTAGAQTVDRTISGRQAVTLTAAAPAGTRVRVTFDALTGPGGARLTSGELDAFTQG